MNTNQLNLKIDCTLENAPKFWDWIQNRGGIAHWSSLDLSDPGRSWSTPATIKRKDCDGPLAQEGNPEDVLPYPRPTWKCASEPDFIVTNPTQVEVHTDKEVKRFHVALRRGGQGLTVKCTDGSSRRIRAAVAKAGDGAYYQFDYEFQQAVIFAPVKTETLAEWAKENGK